MKKLVKKKYPIIGISGNLLIDEGGMFPGYERAYVNNDYIQSVVMCKAIPYIVPIVYDDEIIKEQVSNIDALILSGGQDVNHSYGKKNLIISWRQYHQREIVLI